MIHFYLHRFTPECCTASFHLSALSDLFFRFHFGLAQCNGIAKNFLYRQASDVAILLVRLIIVFMRYKGQSKIGVRKTDRAKEIKEYWARSTSQRRITSTDPKV